MDTRPTTRPSVPRQSPLLKLQSTEFMAQEEEQSA